MSQEQFIPSPFPSVKGEGMTNNPSNGSSFTEIRQSADESLSSISGDLSPHILRMTSPAPPRMPPCQIITLPQGLEKVEVITKNDKTEADLPTPGEKSAPRKFSGDYEDVEEWLQCINKLWAWHTVLASKRKCTLVKQYCTRTVQEVIEGLSSYHTSNWAALKQDLLKYYDAKRVDQRF